MGERGGLMRAGRQGGGVGERRELRREQGETERRGQDVLCVPQVKKKNMVAPFFALSREVKKKVIGVGICAWVCGRWYR